jgi:HK97 family phage major capsid protein
MKWNKQVLHQSIPVWAKQMEIEVGSVKSVNDAIAAIELLAQKGADINGLIVDGEVDKAAVRKAWDTVSLKAVEITYNSAEGDVVNAVDLAGESASMDGEGEETKEADPDEEMSKAYKAFRKVAQKHGQKVPTFMKSIHEASAKGYGSSLAPRSAASHDRTAERKRYDRKAARGETAYSCSDVAEIANSWYRINWLSGTKNADYEWKSYDLDVITKAGSVFDNTLGGFLVPEGVSAEMIELKAQYGVARQLAGFESMPLPKWNVNRFGDDVAVYKTAEGVAMTASDMTFSQVTLSSEEIAALSVMSNRLVNLSPIQMGDTFGRSAARGFGKYEDDSFFNGANGFEGLASKVGANSTKDCTGLTAWSGITLDDLLEWKSLLPDYTNNFSEDEIVISCSRAVFNQVFRKYALAQGGSSMEDQLNAGELRFDGNPIVLNNSTARTFANNAIAAYIGPFKYVTKFGELEGSARVDSSDQRYFEKNQMAMRALEEIAINCHDVNNDLDADGNNASGIVALQVGT